MPLLQKPNYRHHHSSRECTRVGTQEDDICEGFGGNRETQVWGFEEIERHSQEVFVEAVRYPCGVVEETVRHT